MTKILSTTELCEKFKIWPHMLVGTKHYVQVDIKGRPIVMFDRVIENNITQEQWVDITKQAQLKYDSEMLSKEIKKLEVK